VLLDQIWLQQLADYDIWTRYQKVDLEDQDEITTPPLALLNYIDDHKKTNYNSVPFVELSLLCIPEWST
jgi:hypothetical protein